MIALQTNEVSVEREREEVALNSALRRESQDSASKARYWLVRLEYLAVILIALCAIALHVRFVSSVGGLWRDEANSVNLATLPSYGQIWSLIEYDSFPIVFVTVLRAWIAIFGSGNDAALRVLGLLVGLGVLGVLFRNARSLGSRLPVLSLALIGLNPMVIRYGDSVRGYGLGILLILLTFGAFWRLVNGPSAPPRQIFAATVLALLSVHCLFHNSVLLFAIAAGAVAVTIRARAWRTTAIVLGIGAISGSSLLVYAPMMTRKQDWTFMVSHPVDLPWLWKRVCEVLGSPDPLGIWLWLGLLFVGLGVVASCAGARLLRGFTRKQTMAETSDPDQPRSFPDSVLFAASALIVGIIGYAAFLRSLHYYTQPWYYITLVAFVACALDVIFGAWLATTKNRRLPLFLRSSRLVAGLGLLCFTALPDWEEIPIRHTNVDLLAARLQPLASSGDVILVPRWECAIPLSRYYRGPAEIITLPPIDDHRFHRYDLVLRQMMTPDPLQPVLARLEEALRSGHRVFLAGTLSFPPADQPLSIPPPAYRDGDGKWHGGDYFTNWELQVAQLLTAHTARRELIKIPVPGNAPVNGFEKLSLGVMEEWR